MTDRLGSTLGQAIGDTTDLSTFQARIDGAALAWVFQLVTDETGQRSRSGHTPAQIADALGPIASDMFDHLETHAARQPVS
jgi:hypothetical protein